MKKFKFILIICLILSGCSKQTYTVNIKDDNDNLLSSFKVKQGNAIETIEVPEKEGYIFVSWLKDGEEYNLDKPVNGDMELTPKFVEIPKRETRYIVTFNFGDNKKTQTIKKGNTAQKPTDPNKNGYKFLGWYFNDKLYDFNNVINGDIELVAKYSPIKVNVSFDLLGGGGIKKMKINMGSKLSKIKPPTKRGYRFLGWMLNDSKLDEDYIIDKDIKLKAIWEKIEYVKVKFNTDGGTRINDMVIEKGTKLEKIEIPTKKGYEFVGWFLDNKEFNLNDKINDDIVLTAKFTKK